MSKRQRNSQRRTGLLLPAAFVAFGIAALAVVAVLWSVNPGGQASGSGERPSVGGDLHALAVDPTDPERVMVGGHESAAISEDGGQSWQPIEDLSGADPMGWEINPDDPSKMYAGGHPGFYHSEDGGESWNQDNSGLPGTDIHAMGMDPNNPDTLYAYIVGEGIYRSPDAGESWEPVNTEMGAMGPILVDPQDSDTLYVALEDAFLQSTDGGESWEQVGNIPGGGMWVSQDRQAPDTFYAAGGGVSKSTDGGENWRPVGDGLPQNVSVVAVAQSDPNVVYAGALGEDGALLFRSEDGGESWKAVN